jgi:SNF2 family DNA or RNA helicase
MIMEYEMYYKDKKGNKMDNMYKFEALITTFEIVISDCLELREIPWKCCVIDEAHRLKNKNCKLLEGLRLLKLVSSRIARCFKLIMNRNVEVGNGSLFN